MFHMSELSTQFKQTLQGYHSGAYNSYLPMLPYLQLDGKPMTLNLHYPLEPFFKLTMPRRVVFMVARQLGKSISLASRGLLDSAMIPNFHTLYIQPRYDQIKRFSTNYVGPIIKESYLGRVFEDPTREQSILQKSFRNGSNMYFSYAFLDCERCRGFAAAKCLAKGTLIQGTPIEDLKIGRILESVTNEGYIIHNKVQRVEKTGVRPCFRITLNTGHTLTCTIDHKLFSDVGWITIEEMVTHAFRKTKTDVVGNSSRGRTFTNRKFKEENLPLSISARMDSTRLQYPEIHNNEKLFNSETIGAGRTTESREQGVRGMVQSMGHDNQYGFVLFTRTDTPPWKEKEDDISGMVRLDNSRRADVVDMRRREFANKRSTIYTDTYRGISKRRGRAPFKMALSKIRYRKQCCSYKIKKKYREILLYSMFICSRNQNLRGFNSGIYSEMYELQDRLSKTTLRRMWDRDTEQQQDMFRKMFYRPSYKKDGYLYSEKPEENKQKKEGILCLSSGNERKEETIYTGVFKGSSEKRSPQCYSKEMETFKKGRPCIRTKTKRGTEILLSKIERRSRKIQQKNRSSQCLASRKTSQRGYLRDGLYQGMEKTKQRESKDSKAESVQEIKETYGGGSSIQTGIFSSEEGKLSQGERISSKGKVISIEYVGIKDVYDIQMEKQPNFFSNNILTHNCCFDEISDIQYDFISTIGEVLSAQTEYGFYQFTGTPKTIDNTLGVLFSDSSQAEWIIRCGCGKHNIPSLDHDLLRMIGKKTCICANKKCGKPLDISTGEYVHAYPDRQHSFAGYHLSQITHPLHAEFPLKWSEMLYKRSTYPEARFNNEVLGVPCDENVKPLTVMHLKQASNGLINDYSKAVKERKKYDAVVMGVDWSGYGADSISTTTVAVIGIIPGSETVHCIYAERFKIGIKPEDEAKKLIEYAYQFEITYFAHDFSGAGMIREATIVQRGYPVEQIVPFQIVHAPVNTSIINFYQPANGGRSCYNIDKTRSLLVLFEMIKKQQVTLPDWEKNDGKTKDVLSDLLNIMQETRETPRGKDYTLMIKVPNKTDDFAFSLNLACSAIWHIRGRYPSLVTSVQGPSYEDMALADPHLANWDV